MGSEMCIRDSCGRGDIENNVVCTVWLYFYSRPCGRGDEIADAELTQRVKFLLTPLREGRPVVLAAANRPAQISTHAPAGGATR